VALIQKGDYSYGDSQADIRAELSKYSEYSTRPIHHAADTACGCGSRLFNLDLDDEAGVAVRSCHTCKTEHVIGDGGANLEDAELERCECACGSAAFEITAGLSLFPESEDVQWLYIGCRCPSCGLTACYGDWPNEFDDYRKLLACL